MTLYKRKYRVESTRLQSGDYSRPGYYFVTINCKNREQFLGAISNEKMAFSKAGVIADHYWQKIPEHFEHVSLDEYVIMPDHIHGIVIIHLHRERRNYRSA